MVEAPVQQRPAALETRNVTKMFGDFVADSDVSLRVEPGEIHALLGENGAGKSTLMNMCFGILQPTSGEILVNGEVVAMTSPTTARQHGIGMVHQHFKLVPSLTVAENVFLGAEPLTSHRSLDRTGMVKGLTEVSERYGLKVDPTSTVANLSAGLRQRVEILKALYFEARVLILDEPTAVLTPQETDGLFEVLRGLAADDRSVILITHKLPEVKAVANRFSVMRRGKFITTGDTADVSEHDMATLMVGREVSLDRLTPAPTQRGEAPTAMSCHDLVLQDTEGHTVLNKVSLDLRAGEITGIAGVEGNGQTELVQALAGLHTVVTGTVRLAGRDITADSPAQRRVAGLAHVPEDRLESGVSGVSSVQDNITGGFLRSNLFNRGVLRNAFTRNWTAELIRRYDVRGARPSTRVHELSGGNMQKVVLARELESRPAVLLAAQPTRGVDIGATQFVHNQLREQAERGAAILLVSADLGELLAVSDRLLVMYRGEVVAEFAPEEDKVARIGLAMAGSAESRDAYIPPPELDTTDVRQDAAEVRADKQTIELAGTAESAGAGVASARTGSGVGGRFLTGLSQPVIAVAAALIIGLVMISALGDNPFLSYKSFLFGSFQSQNNFSAMVAQATPLLLVAVSVYVSFRAGVINIGAEGQMYIGAFLGACIALGLKGTPGPLLILLSFLGGAIGGALWAFIPGLLDAYLGVDILVTTLMFNYIGMSVTSYFVDGPLRDPSAGIAATKTIPRSASLPTILGTGGANIGIFVGLVAVVLTGLLIKRSKWGLQARFVGENRSFARYLGVNVRLKIIQIVLISGALAGIAGVGETLGTQQRFNQTFSPGYGFIGLTVALLGRLNPVGLVVAAVLYGVLEEGSTLMQLDTGVPLSLVNVLEGVIIVLTTAAALGLRRRRARNLPITPTGALESSATTGVSEATS